MKNRSLSPTSDRRQFLGALGIATACAAAAPLLAAPKPDKRPDILLIMADDMGFSDIGCYGGEIRTPTLNRLAEKGLRFTQFYNTARCCPTRASLITGLYPHQTGVGHMADGDRNLDGYRGDMNNRCVTIAEVMKLARYSTYMSGKWHVTKYLDEKKHNWPRQRGFDRFYGTILGAGSFYDPVTLTRENTRIKAPMGEYNYTDAVSENAVRFIEEHAKAKPETPYFMYVAYTAPHWPLHASDEDIAKYKGHYDAGWDATRAARLKRMVDMGIIDSKWSMTERGRNIPPWDEAKNKAWEARRMEVYAAQVDRMDKGISRIVASLEKTGRLDNTLIFFLADNGGCAEVLTDKWRGRFITRKTRDGRDVQVGNDPNVMPGSETTYQSYGPPWANASNTPFRLYKHYVHEGGISSPLIVHWPDQIRSGVGALRSQQGHLIDIMTTCVDVAGADYPKRFKGVDIQPMEGKSLLPAFADKPLNRDAIYWEHEGNRAMRRGKWKLVARGWKGKWELYDMESDRTETRDLASRETERVEQMAAQWQLWAKRTWVVPYRKQKPPKKTS